MSTSDQRPGLLERLAEGPVICAEGYLFELERRGYLQAGAYVPEVVLDHPEEVTQLHRQFVHAGSDVVEAFTYYAHREKLRIIGKEELIEDLNRQALALAKEVAVESGALFAGDICNTNVYESGNAAAYHEARAMFEEQVGWAVEAGVDFIIGETFSYAEEALIGLEVIKQTGLPAVITLAVHRAPETREGWSVAEACKRLADAGADVVGLNCIRGPRTMLPLLREIVPAVDVPVAALPVPYRTHPEEPSFQSLRDPDYDSLPSGIPFPQPLRDRGLHPRSPGSRGPLLRRVLRRGTAPHPQHGRGPGPHAAREPLLRGYVQTRLPRHRRGPATAERGVQARAVAWPSPHAARSQAWPQSRLRMRI